MFDFRHFYLKEQLPLTDSNQTGFSFPKDSFGHLTDESYTVQNQLSTTEARNRLRWVLYEENADRMEQQHFLPNQCVKRDYDYKLLNAYDEDSMSLCDCLIGFLSSGDEDLCLASAKLFFDLFKVSLAIRSTLLNTINPYKDPQDTVGHV